MLWPTSPSSSLPKATVDTNIQSSNSDYPVDFTNTFDNSRPSSPAPPPPKFSPLDTSATPKYSSTFPFAPPSAPAVPNPPPLRTPPESPVKAHRRNSFRRSSIQSSVLFPLHEQNPHPHRYQQGATASTFGSEGPGRLQEEDEEGKRGGPHHVIPPVSVNFSSPPTSPTQRSPASSLPPKLSLSLAEHPLFRDCTPSGIELLASRMHIRHYHPQDHIIRRSEQSSAMFYVLRGTVKVVSHDNEATYYEIKENNFFGDVGVLYRVPRSMDVLAKNRCTIAILSGEDLVKAMEQSPEMAKAIGYQTQERYQMYLKRRQSISARCTLDGGSRGPDQLRDDPISENFVKSDVHNAIRKVSLFQNCSSEVIHLLSLNVEPRKYNLGQTIVRRGEIGHEMFFIASGVVEVLSDDNLRVLARFHDGQFFGEIAVILDVPRIANVKAVSEVEVFVLTKDNLQAVFKAVPGAAETITSEGHRLYQNWLNSNNSGLTDEPMSLDVSANTSTFTTNNTSSSNDNRTTYLDGVPIAPWSIESGDSQQPMTEGPQRRSTDFASSPSFGFTGGHRHTHPGALSRRLSTSLENLHPIEAGHPASVSVLPLTFNGELPSGHRIGTVQTASPPSWLTQETGSPLDATVLESKSTHPFSSDSSPLDMPMATSTSAAPQSFFEQGIDKEMVNDNINNFNNTFNNDHSTAHEPPTSRNPTIRGLQESNPKRRRASVAVWTQQDLMKLAAAAEQKSTVDSSTHLPAVAYGMSESISAATINNSDVQVPEHPFMQSQRQSTLSSFASSTTMAPIKQKTGPTTFNDLDEPIVAYILGCLPLDVLLKVRQVCKAWNKLILEHDSILQVVDLGPYKKTVSDAVLEELCNTVLSRNKTRTTFVSLRDCFSISDKGLATLAINVPSVRVLDLHSCWNVTDAGFRMLGEYCHQLRSVDFSNCRKLGDATIFGLFPKLATTSALPPSSSSSSSSQPTTIEEDVQATQELMEHLSSAESEESTEQEAVPSAQQLTSGPTTLPVQEADKGCPQLARLNLSYCKNVTDKGFLHLAEFGSQQLESLNLQRCTTVPPEAFIALDSISQRLSSDEDSDLIEARFPNLKELVLSDCTFLTDAAIVSLAPHVPQLEIISLSFCCALTDVSIEAISDHCRLLRKMDLSFCGSAVSDASLYRLAQGPKSVEEDDSMEGDTLVDQGPHAATSGDAGSDQAQVVTTTQESPLQELEIRGCVRVTELGVREILVGCKQLRKLNISSCSGIGTATLLEDEERAQQEEEERQRMLQLEQSGFTLPPQVVPTLQDLPDPVVDVAMASPQGEALTNMDIDPLATAAASDDQTLTLASPQGTAAHTNANNPRASGCLAQPKSANSTDLSRKMNALKRGKEWALAQQRPGLEIIV
ncbi:hypothetical protein BGZ94_004292 [Podila epigama]|nr:hypothetical protein BGZ94_004292 [Podila epigama]